ncbi:MAG: hypothetical protein E6K96_03995 [Thaumarchaeota archaeon]|nr:MAG: hypothetical protein E6K96_03995 [Nitrososphaerota archaeon]
MAFLILLLVALPYDVGAQPQEGPVVTVTNQYIVNRYGYAVMNETVKYNNSGSSPVQIPTLQMGVPQNISSRLVGNYSLVGEGYSLTTTTAPNSTGLLFSVSSQNTLQPKAVSGFSLEAVIGNISLKTNSSTGILVLEYPSLNLQVNTFNALIQMPTSTFISPLPQGWTSNQSSASRATYKRTFTGFSPASPHALLGTLQSSTSMDFHPIHVYSASRFVTAASNGSPQVQDSITLKNSGISDLTSLHLATLNSSARVTVIPSMSPPLLNPTSVAISNGVIDLTRSPFVAIPSGRNFTLTVAYALPAKFYTVSGGNVQVDLPLTPPIAAPADTFTLGMSLPNGLRATQAQSRVVENATPITPGGQTFAYSLTLGWASDRAIPAASVIFVVALVAFFVSVERQEGEEAEGEEKEGGGISGDIPDMIKAFEEKVDLVNTMLREVPKEDPNNLNKAYFVDLRSRVDTFRSKALQRLNDAKQKSTAQRFTEQLTRIHDVEREVDRATRDILNLYEQYYTKRMRQETFEKLLPSYRKRLEGALNQLSDQLNLTQREAKML